VKSKFKSLLSNGLVKSTGVLVGGTAFAQALTILVLPILTRLYTPDDFSLLAVYTAILAIVSSVACLRFEIAIPLPSSDDVAIRLVCLALLSVVAVTGASLITLWAFSNEIGLWTNSALSDYWWMLPVGIMGAGVYTVFQYWAVRKKKFHIVARTRIVQSISAASTQVTFGVLGIAPIGLIIGQIVQSGAGAYRIARNSFPEIVTGLRKSNVSDIKKTFSEYSRFPKYSTWEALANSGGIQFPIILIAGIMAGPEAGFIMLAMRLLSAPMALLGGAVSQVYLSEAANKHQIGELEEFTRKIVLQLAKVGLMPILLVAIGAPFLVPLIFGAEWTRVGLLISWMAPWFLMQFIASPVSMSLHIIGKQKEALILQVAGLFFRVGTVMGASMYIDQWVGEAYALSGIVFYAFYIVVILYLLNKSARPL